MPMFHQLKDIPRFVHESTQVVSLDVFDTMLWRHVPWERVAKRAVGLLADRIKNRLGVSLDPEALIRSRLRFKEERERAEIPADRHWNVSQWLNQVSATHGLDEQIVQDAGRECEINAEAAFLSKGPFVGEILERLRKKEGLLVIAISDIWIEDEWMGELLERFDIKMDAIFTSCSMKASKKEGTLFREASRKLHRQPDAFLHAGDNLFHDKLRAQIRGWRSMWVPRKHPKYGVWIPKPAQKGILSWSPHFDLISLLDHKPSDSSDVVYRAAYSHLAPLMIIYSIYQWKLFSKYSINDAYYIARDAYCMKYAYDMLEKYLPGSPRRHYIRLSRKSLALAHPDDLLVTAQPLPGKVGKKTVDEWLSNFVLPEELSDVLLAEAGYSRNSSFDKAFRRSFVKACRKHSEEIAACRADLSAMIRDYLVQITGRQPAGRIAIVDSGWAGTIQDILSHVLYDVEGILGIYLGVSNQGHPSRPASLKFGMLRDDYRSMKGRNPWEGTAGVIRLWDTLLREPVGTTRRLARRGDGTIHAQMDSPARFGEKERELARTVFDGVRAGIEGYRASIPLIVNVSTTLTLEDLMSAAKAIAFPLTTCPHRHFVEGLEDIGFDEGAAAGQWQSLHSVDLKAFTAWIPGLLCKYRLGPVIPWMTPLLQVAIQWQKLRAEKTSIRQHR